MRLVHLKQTKDYSPFDEILRHGCGPHFVLNRMELFESMIKEQGLTFWFRFWLNFCHYPGCDDLIIINKEWPEMRDYVNSGVHALFVNGTIEEACQYSLNVIKLMRVNLPDLKTLLTITSATAVSNPGLVAQKKKKRKDTLCDLLQTTYIKCSGMAFGANLCVLFYEWLGAKTAEENILYYRVPKKYLEPNFVPGDLEIFLANEWKEKLAWLLGVSYYEVPWLRKLLTGKISSKVTRKSSDRLYRVQDVKLVAKLLSIKRNEKRMAIRRVDEMSNVYENYMTKFKNIRKRKLSSKSKLIEGHNRNGKSTRCLCNKIQKCARCYKVLKHKHKVKRCKRCIEEKWMEPRCYCSSFCKVQHWYQNHQKEHYDIRNELSAESVTNSLPPSITKSIS